MASGSFGLLGGCVLMCTKNVNKIAASETRM